MISQINEAEMDFKSRFLKNINELNDLYCWNLPGFYQGKFEFRKMTDFSAESFKTGLKIFPEISGNTFEYYRFFDSLELVEKQNLIRYFTFYEVEFENCLKKNGLPTELKYLPPALSAMNPNAMNFEGKTGIWQLTHFQAILNGAEINLLVDDRFNESTATQIATQLLKQNFEIYDTPGLAVIAFIEGNTRVKNAIYRAENETSISDFLNYLPQSIQESIPAFQAMAVFLNHNKFIPENTFFAEKVKPDTVMVNRQLHFQQISRVLKISENELKFLNPQFKFLIVPGNIRPTKLVLPDKKWDDFVLWQDSIYKTFDSIFFEIVTQKIEYPPPPNRQYLNEPVKDLEIDGKTKIQYRIKTGDVLGIIAEKYDVHVSDLKYWNNIYNERKIQAGQKLDIFVDDSQFDYFSNLEQQKTKEKENTGIVNQIQTGSTLKVFEELNSAIKIEHVVKSGESPFTIAQKYDGVSPEELLEWNKIDDPRKIQIGQKLTVYLKK